MLTTSKLHGIYDIKTIFPILAFRAGAEGAVAPIPFFLVFPKCFTILLLQLFYKMLLNSIFRNVQLNLLCITNTPTMLYAACPEKSSFPSWSGRGEGGGEGGKFGPLFLNFLDTPLFPVCFQKPKSFQQRF